MRLFYSANSPYVRKVMVVAHELGFQDKIEKVPASSNPVQRNAVLMAENPLGKVPVLVLDDGMTLFDSPVIAEYLASLSDKGDMVFPAHGAARWRALVEQALGDGVLDAGVLLRYETALRPKEFQWQGWIDGQMAKITAALDRIEATAVDPNATIGSISIACALGYLDLRFPEIGWRAKLPRRAHWFETFAARQSMTATESPELKR